LYRAVLYRAALYRAATVRERAVRVRDALPIATALSMHRSQVHKEP
jgi:hypothetical protein